MKNFIGLRVFSKEINSKWILEIRDYVLESLYAKEPVLKINAGYSNIGKSGTISMNILTNKEDKDSLISEIGAEFPFFNVFETEKIVLSE